MLGLCVSRNRCLILTLEINFYVWFVKCSLYFYYMIVGCIIEKMFCRELLLRAYSFHLYYINFNENYTATLGDNGALKWNEWLYGILHPLWLVGVKCPSEYLGKFGVCRKGVMYMIPKYNYCDNC